MAVLGAYGEVSLSREWQQPAVLSGSRLIDGVMVKIDLSEPGVWSGDRVVIICERGIPVIASGEQYAPCPDGHSFYGDSDYSVGPAVAARTSGGAMYAASDSDPFYETDLSKTKAGYFYVNRDELDNITFWENELDAINGAGGTMLDLSYVDCGNFSIIAAPSGSYQTQTVNSVALEAANVIIADESPGDQVFTLATQSILLQELEILGGTESGWKILSSLTSWVFETNVDMLDLNAIGQEFGEATKGMLRGAGSFEANIDYGGNGVNYSASTLLKLMLLTQTGATAMARFLVAPPEKIDCYMEPMCYETPIIFSKTSVNVNTTDVIKMSADFLSTGRIRLITAPLN